jgi:hypothetical protein
LICAIDNKAVFSNYKASMDSPRLTMPYLESLSTGELLGLAEKFGVDLPEGLERIFIIEELMELEEDAARNVIHNEQEESRELLYFPESYHKTSIDVLIRDPLWAFVFWEVNESGREKHENAADFKGYSLKIIPVGNTPGDKGGSPSANVSFLVAVSKNDNARYIGFPPEGGRGFQVELCAVYEEKSVTLAVTAPFTMPRLIEPVAAGGKTGADFLNGGTPNPLTQLSGADRFILTRSRDRMSRMHESHASYSGHTGV